MFTRLFSIALALLSLAGSSTALPTMPAIPTTASSGRPLDALSSLDIIPGLNGDSGLALGSHSPLSLLGRVIVPAQAHVGDAVAPALDRAAGEPLIKRAERFQLRMARSAA